VRAADVVVVGGGVAGCAAAYFLAREGLAVTLLERDALAAHASGAAAGMLLPYGEAAFAGPLLDWGVESLALFPELCSELRERTGIDPELVECGALHVARSEAREASLRASAGALSGAGVAWLDPEAARSAEPALAGDVRGVLFAPREAHVRSPLLARSLASAAAQLGARVEVGVAVGGLLRRGDEILGVRTPDGERHAGRVVLCTGAWASACADWLGGAWRPAVEPLRGQILALDAPSPPLAGIVVGEDVYLVPKRDGSVVVGATEESVGFDCRVTAEGLGGLLTAAPRLAPPLASATFRFGWAGLRPATPDGLPLIGPAPGVRGLLLAAGHTRNGVLLAPITGRLVADLVLGKELPERAGVFAPDRF